MKPLASYAFIMPNKPTPKRSTNASCFIRMSGEEREVMEKAALRLLGNAGIAGAKLGLGKFLLSSGLKEALQQPVRAQLPNFRYDMFNVSHVVKALGLTDALTYPVLAVLRDLATAGVVNQHSATDFFVPKKAPQGKATT